MQFNAPTIDDACGLTKIGHESSNFEYSTYYIVFECRL